MRIPIRHGQRWVRRWLTKHWLPVSTIVGLVGFVAIAYAALELAPNWFAESDGLTPKDRASARQGVRTAALALLAGGLTVIGAFYTGRTFALNRAGQITDRFTKAIEQLGHPDAIDVRLGGIYALERVAKDSKHDHPQVVEVLTAYIRGHTARRPPAAGNTTEPAAPSGTLAGPSRPDSLGRLDTDVQAALTVLGRRTLEHEKDTATVVNLGAAFLGGADLSWARLAGANLRAANLSKAHLPRANLSGADLVVARLHGAYLDGANLSGAYLDGAELGEAYLVGANIGGAHLHRAHLYRANLYRANLSGAYLGRATLSGADVADANLSGANLGGADLTHANLSGANLSEANLSGAILVAARYDKVSTRWPDGFDAEAAGAIGSTSTAT